MSPSPEAPARPAGPLDLFVTFTLLALQGFGGVLAVTQRVLCEQKRWLTRQQFLEILSLGQVLPGPNVCNVALMVGDRFHGLRGAFAALAGMLAVPLVLVLALAALYVHYAAHPLVAGALKGMGAVAAGMIAGTALRLAGGLRGNALGPSAMVAFGAATFVLIALLRLPLVWVIVGLGVLACTTAWWRLGTAAAAERQ